MLKKMMGALALLCAALALSLSAHAAEHHYSVEYTVAELLKNPQAAEVLEKYLPGLSQSPELEMAKGLTLAQIAEYPQSGIDEEQLKALNAELAKIKADGPPAD